MTQARTIQVQVKTTVIGPKTSISSSRQFPSAARKCLKNRATRCCMASRSVLLVCNLLSCRCLRREHMWLLGHYDPGDGVRKQTDARHHGSYQPHQTNDSHVDIKVFGNAEANTCDLASFAGANQPLASDHTAYTSAAVRANVGIILDGFAAIVTVHSSTSPLGIRKSVDRCSPSGALIGFFDSFPGSFGLAGAGVQ